jgi:hypothetical protein
LSVLGLPAALLAAVPLTSAQAATSTSITVDGTQGGRTFDGIGAISGGFWSTDTINYLISWLGCAKQHNLTWDRGSVTTPLRGQESGRCVDVPAADQANGTQPALWDCNGAGNQAWTSTANGRLTVFDTKCLQPIGGGTADGTGVEIHDCDGSAGQQWNVRSDGTVVGVASGKCLDADAHGTANSTPLDIWTCTGGTNQIWGTGR